MQLLTENCSRRVFLKKGTAGVIATTGLLNFGVNSMLSSTSSLLNDRNSKVLTKQGGFTSGIEGPATDSEGNLYAVNYQQQHTIGKITPEGQSEIFVTLPKGSTGNGIRFNSNEEMLVADYTGHNILKINMKTREINIFAHESKMNQPNDLAIGANDILYASDPAWNKSTGQIWRIDTSGNVKLIEPSAGTTNGIEVSPNERTLYVNESIQRNVWAYDLSPTGEISNKRLLIRFTDFNMDGMRCDIDGNLYITRHGKGTVAKVSPQGKLLGEIRLNGKNPSNLAFGGTDGKTCYVTLADNGNIEVFQTDLPGRSWQLRQK
jgi:sugar lactone lactonase YvrE